MELTVVSANESRVARSEDTDEDCSSRRLAPVLNAACNKFEILALIESTASWTSAPEAEPDRSRLSVDDATELRSDTPDDTAVESSSDADAATEFKAVAVCCSELASADEASKDDVNKDTASLLSDFFSAAETPDDDDASLRTDARLATSCLEDDLSPLALNFDLEDENSEES